jgi:hypothetical protein
MGSYNLEDAENIRISAFDYKLPQLVHDKIKHLAFELSGIIAAANAAATSNIITQYANEHKQHHHHDHDQRPERPTKKLRFEKPQKNSRYTAATTTAPFNHMDAVWEKQKAFIATKIEKKEGIDKLINDIRICLNKISGKNYDSQKEAILLYISQIKEKNRDIMDLATPEVEDTEINEKDDLRRIAVSIFETASTNKFYSELYASLYKELSVNYPIFIEIIDGFIQSYLENIENIRFVDSTVDYDKFCVNNKENDKRKAMTVFMVNLMKKGIFPKNEVLNIIIEMQNNILKYVDMPNKVNDVEEITENIFLFITNIEKECVEIETWKQVVENIKTCSQFKVKEHQSISSRAIFKYKDLCDIFRKTT